MSTTVCLRFIWLQHETLADSTVYQHWLSLQNVVSIAAVHRTLLGCFFVLSERREAAKGN